MLSDDCIVVEMRTARPHPQGVFLWVGPEDSISALQTGAEAWLAAADFEIGDLGDAVRWLVDANQLLRVEATGPGFVLSATFLASGVLVEASAETGSPDPQISASLGCMAYDAAEAALAIVDSVATRAANLWAGGFSYRPAGSDGPSSDSLRGLVDAMFDDADGRLPFEAMLVRVERHPLACPDGPADEVLDVLVHFDADAKPRAAEVVARASTPTALSDARS